MKSSVENIHFDSVFFSQCASFILTKTVIDNSYNQNDSYEIAINGFQVRKIRVIRNAIFGLRYDKPSSALRPKLGCSPSTLPSLIVGGLINRGVRSPADIVNFGRW